MSTSMRKPTQFNFARVEKAHHVRRLRKCGHCTGFGSIDNMINLDGLMLHGRCFISINGLEALLFLSKEQTKRLCLGDIGADAMRALLAKEEKKKRPVYVPCKDSPDGKHRFERLKRNQFEKCMNCGEPRFALTVEESR